MRYRSLDINLLVLLDILLDTSSITRTAEILHRTQPAVSAALSRLREHFNDDLLVQVGRVNKHTDLASRLREPLKDLLARTDALISMRSGFDPQHDTRHFSVIGSDYVSTLFGHDLARAVTLIGPKLSVELETMRPGAFDRFERGEIDVLIAPEHMAFPDYVKTPLLEDRFVCAVWAGHPITGDRMTLEQYMSCRHVVHRIHGGNKFTVVDQWFLDKKSIERDIAAEVPSFGGMLQVLPGTHLVATAQYLLARKLAETLPIRLMEAPFDFPRLPIVMQSHPHLTGDAGIAWFRDRVVEAVAHLCERPSGIDPRYGLHESN